MHAQTSELLSGNEAEDNNTADYQNLVSYASYIRFYIQVCLRFSTVVISRDQLVHAAAYETHKILTTDPLAHH